MNLYWIIIVLILLGLFLLLTINVCKTLFYNFWSNIKKKPGETPTELAARVRQMATTCDFLVSKIPLDEAMRTCFICAINNEAVLKCVLREPEVKLAVNIATEVEETA